MQINFYLDLVRDTTLGQLISGTMSQDYTGPRQSTLIMFTIINHLNYLANTASNARYFFGIKIGSRVDKED